MSVESRLTPAALLAIASLAGEAYANNETHTNNSPQSAPQVAYAAGTLPTFTGPEHLFTGRVDVVMAFPEQSGVPYSGAYVTFQPGARTAWHDHPAGQHMVVTRGAAITVTRDGQVVRFGEGEAVWCPPGVDHWHGATPHSAMTHFVVTGSKDGSAVNWKDKVSDAQYQAALAALAVQAPVLKTLDVRQQQLAAVVAFAAADDAGSLVAALNEALDAGVTISDLKETMVHLYPYGGFPKSLNGLGALMQVVETRKTAGKQDKPGKDPQPLPAAEQAQATGAEVQTALVGRPVAGPLFDFAPVANTFLQKHLFGDVFARGVLSHQDREVLTVAILASLPGKPEGTASQLRSHIGMAKNTGVTVAQLEDLGRWLEYRVTASAGKRIQAALSDQAG